MARFVRHLHDAYGVTSIDIVGHSRGGLYARSAIKKLRDEAAPIQVLSLTTLGTPWHGGFVADIAAGDRPVDVCEGQAACVAAVEAYQGQVAGDRSLAYPGTRRFLDGDGNAPGWNDRQGPALEGIPVTAIGGSHFRLNRGNPEVWPNDGLVALSSAHAAGVTDKVLPSVNCITRLDVHSIFVARMARLSDRKALTADPAVMSDVVQAISDAGQDANTPGRSNCGTL